MLIETFLTPSGTRWERRLVLMLLAFKVQGEHPILALAAKALPLSDRKACLVASSSLQGRAQLPTWLLWIWGPAQGFPLLKNTAVLDLFLRSQITVRFFFFPQNSMPAFHITSLAITGHGMKWNWGSGEQCDHGTHPSFQGGQGQDRLPQVQVVPWSTFATPSLVSSGLALGGAWVLQSCAP